MELIEVQKIWDKAPHNSVTDLIYFNNQFFCGLREGSEHMSYDGKLRIISSNDGKIWDSKALLEIEGEDLRDPKFSVTPNCELMITAGIRIKKEVGGQILQSITFFSKDGLSWSKGYKCPTGEGTWRWSTTWHNGTAYSFSYGSGKHKDGCLFSSKDGKNWEIVKDEVFPKAKERGNETSLLFVDDKAYCFLRRDGGTHSAMLGTAVSPYTNWNWKDLEVYVGGPKMIKVNNRFLIGGRLFNDDEEVYTALCWLEENESIIKEVIRLPSDGDCSYPGIINKNGVLWVSYYSSHEDKSAIYLAKVKI